MAGSAPPDAGAGGAGAPGDGPSPRTQPAGTAQAGYDRARALMGQGRAALAEAHGVLRALSPRVGDARSRGRINRQSWECERALGRRPHHFSQAGQDAWLDERVFRGRRGGVFVEVGGYDGITGSNCLFFEMMRGWTGLLVEPSPAHHARAAAFRRVPCLQVAVAARAGEAEFMEVTGGLSQMSGLTESYDPGLRAAVEADPRHEGALIRVETRPLAAILEEHGLPAVDYVSLDVEGGEMAVLEGFPFERHRVTAWTIENNAGGRDVPALMSARGYLRVEALGVDDVYVLEEAWRR